MPDLSSFALDFTLAIKFSKEAVSIVSLSHSVLMVYAGFHLCNIGLCATIKPVIASPHCFRKPCWHEIYPIIGTAVGILVKAV